MQPCNLCSAKFNSKALFSVLFSIFLTYLYFATDLDLWFSELLNYSFNQWSNCCLKRSKTACIGMAFILKLGNLFRGHGTSSCECFKNAYFLFYSAFTIVCRSWTSKRYLVTRLEKCTDSGKSSNVRIRFSTEAGVEIVKETRKTLLR